MLLVWNSRRVDKGTFGNDYEKLTERNRTEPNRWTRGKDHLDSIFDFFGTDKIAKRKLVNRQKLDIPQLLSRIRSASYLPNAGEKSKNLEEEAKELFQTHRVGEIVTMAYDTEIFLGRLV